jgi:hypothetical protein
VTNDQLTTALSVQANKLTLRVCGILGGMLVVGFATVGLAIALS